LVEESKGQRVFNESLRLLRHLLSRRKLTILLYHQVLEQPDPMRPWEPTKEEFEWQMGLLSQYSNPLPLGEAIKKLGDGSLPANAVSVTFDDGYANNLHVAEPILARFNVPATVYVATGYIGKCNMWNDRISHLFSDESKAFLSLFGEHIELGDWEHRRSLAFDQIRKYKYRPVEERSEAIDSLYRENEMQEQAPLMLTVDELKELRRRGVEIGGHTVNHPILSSLSLDDQREEIAECKSMLEQWLSAPVIHFAYPNGIQRKDFNEITISAVKEAGFQSAVITGQGISDRSTSLFLLRRFLPWDKNPLKFHFRLLQNTWS